MSTFEIVVLSAIGGFFLWSVWQSKTAARRSRRSATTCRRKKRCFEPTRRTTRISTPPGTTSARESSGNLGYRLVGNLGMEGVDSYVRASVSSDGHECIGFYHAKFPRIRGVMMRLLGIKDHYVIEATTSFSDGSTETTTTAPENLLLSLPEPLHRVHMDTGSTLRKVAMTHSGRVSTILAERPDLRVVPVNTFEDLVASMRREEELKRAHYAATEGISREDFERIARPQDRGVAHQVYDEVEALRGRPIAETPRAVEPKTMYLEDWFKVWLMVGFVSASLKIVLRGGTLGLKALWLLPAVVPLAYAAAWLTTFGKRRPKHPEREDA